MDTKSTKKTKTTRTKKSSEAPVAAPINTADVPASVPAVAPTFTSDFNPHFVKFVYERDVEALVVYYKNVVALTLSDVSRAYAMRAVCTSRDWFFKQVKSLLENPAHVVPNPFIRMQAGA